MQLFSMAGAYTRMQKLHFQQDTSIVNHTELNYGSSSGSGDQNTGRDLSSSPECKAIHLMPAC